MSQQQDHFERVERAIDPASYYALGFGQYHPIDTNDTPAGRSRNRRVEILFSWEPWPSTTMPSPSTETPP